MVIFFFLVLLMAIVALGITVQRWMFKHSDEIDDPEWELYQQRYD
jgi:sensor domain CHASE-containing protein